MPFDKNGKWYPSTPSGQWEPYVPGQKTTKEPDEGAPPPPTVKPSGISALAANLKAALASMQGRTTSPAGEQLQRHTIPQDISPSMTQAPPVVPPVAKPVAPVAPQVASALSPQPMPTAPVYDPESGVSQEQWRQMYPEAQTVTERSEARLAPCNLGRSS